MEIRNSATMFVRNALRNASLFFAIWVIVMVIYTLTGKVNDFEYLWKFFLLPALFLSCIALLATALSTLFSVRTGLNWIFLLLALALDQGIKAYLFSMDWESISIALIPPVFYIRPTHNTLGSYLWVLLGFKNVPHLLNIILFSMIGLVFFEVWRFYVKKKRNSFWINGFIHLFLAGLGSNLLDNAIWGGSLDYITIRPFYTFDLKDLYITLCELFLLTELIDNRLLKRFLNMPREDSTRINREFIAFVLGDLGIRRPDTPKKDQNPEQKQNPEQEQEQEQD